MALPIGLLSAFSNGGKILKSVPTPVWYGVGGLVLFYFGNRYYKKRKVEKLIEEIRTDPKKSEYAEQARRLYSAIDGAGTDEKAIYQVALEITNYPAVQIMYKALFNVELEDDLLGDLRSSEYQKFQRIIKSLKK